MIELLKAALMLLGVFIYMFLGMVIDVIISDDEGPDMLSIIFWLPLLVLALILEQCSYLILSAVNTIYQSIRRFLRKE